MATTEETETFQATGRRKEAVARVSLAPGEGVITVNGEDLDEYFTTPSMKIVATEPLKVAERVQKFDIKVKAHGGGLMGQAGAVSHGIARALCLADAELRGPLKQAGLLTRDARMKERKKPGQPGARKRFQFSKR
ncbi:MAG: 30S ribosomal protein S9 [Verrucomicrobiota bacterium]